MNNKILILGGLRAGKTTILSSIIAELRKNMKSSICTVGDSRNKKDSANLSVIDNAYFEHAHDIESRNVNTEFVIDNHPAPSYKETVYPLNFTVDDNNLTLNFVDVPGTFIDTCSVGYKNIISHVMDADVIIIAINTPYMMNATDKTGYKVNDIKNSIYEITFLMSNVLIKNHCDLKRIIFCPVKCEKWILEGKGKEVDEKVCETYKELINHMISKPEVSIQIMPVMTSGGVEFTELRPAMLYYKDSNDCIGTSCSTCANTNLIIDINGKFIRKDQCARIEEDESYIVYDTKIPLPWYKINGRGFSPKFCEQLGYNILSFIINKGEISQEENKESNSKTFVSIFHKETSLPNFRKEIAIWKEVVEKLNRQNLIKTFGDGFCNIKNKIN